MDVQKSVFETLYGVDVSGHIEKKKNLSYVSWVWAWAEVKKRYPDAVYTVYENADGWNYHTDGRTCWVKVGVTIGGLEHVEYLPVMDYRNASIPAEVVTSTDVNKAIQRAVTKACARHGLGLCVYAGEDLPEAQSGAQRVLDDAARAGVPTQREYICKRCGKPVHGAKSANGTVISAAQIFETTGGLCLGCVNRG